jgi:hypothetical protein
MTNAQEAGGSMRFRDRTIAFGGLAAGRDIEIPSASPVNYHQVISKPADMPPVTIDGKLFLPASYSASRSGAEGLPLVMIVPGSLGVAPSHLAHAETLTRVICDFRARQFWSPRSHLDSRQPDAVLVRRQRL